MTSEYTIHADSKYRDTSVVAVTTDISKHLAVGFTDAVMAKFYQCGSRVCPIQAEILSARKSD